MSTLIELLRFAPEFGAVGSKSYGTIELAVQPNPGDVLRIEDPFSLPPMELYLVAGTDFDIGADTDETAANLAAALSGIVVGSSSGSTITVVSSASGAATLFPWSSDFGTLAPTDALGTGAPGPVPLALESACSMIGPGCYGAKTSTASLYLAAHLLALEGFGDGGKGMIMKRKIDKLETQYNVPGVPSDKDLGATKFGRMLVALKRTVFFPPVVGRTRRPGSGCC